MSWHSLAPHQPLCPPHPSQHSLGALQRPGHGLHQRVKALGPLLISLQPVNNCANDGRPPLGHGVGACGAGGTRERGVQQPRGPQDEASPGIWGGGHTPASPVIAAKPELMEGAGAGAPLASEQPLSSWRYSSASEKRLPGEGP